MFFDQVYSAGDSPSLWQKLWFSFQGAVVFMVLSLPVVNNVMQGAVSAMFRGMNRTYSPAMLMYSTLSLKSVTYMFIVFLMMIF